MTTAVDLATAIVLVRLLPKEEFAVLSMLLVIYELSRQVCLMGYPESILYYAEELGEDRHRSLAKKTISTIFKFALIAAGLMLLAAAIAHIWLPNWSPENVSIIKKTIPILALSAIIEFPTWATTQILISREHDTWAGVYESSTSILLLCSLLIPIILGLPILTLVYALLGYAIVRLIASLVLLALALPKNSQPLPENFSTQQRRYSIPLGLQAFVGRANRYVDRFVIGYLLMEGALAHYQVAAQDVPFLKAFPMGFAGVVVPVYARLFARKKKSDALEMWLRSIRVVSPLAIGTAIFLFIEARPLIVSLFGPEYEPVVWPFRIFTIVVLNKWTHFGSIAQGASDTKSLFRITGITLVINIILNIPLTSAFGISGAAAATVTAGLTGWILMLRLNASHLNTSFRRVVDWKHILQTLCAAVTTGGIVLATFEFTGWSQLSPAWHATVFGLIYLPLYAVAAWLFGVFTKDHTRGLLYLFRFTQKADKL